MIFLGKQALTLLVHGAGTVIIISFLEGPKQESNRIGLTGGIAAGWI
jgi:hypothetical protein